MPSRIMALIVKEFLALMKDRKGRIVIILPPIAQLIVFGYAATFDLNHVRFAVFDEDRGAVSRELVSRFQGSGTFELVAELHGDREIAPLLDERRVALVLHIGPGCTEDLFSGRQCEVQAIVDGRNSNTALLILNYAREIFLKFNREQALLHGAGQPPSRLLMRAWFNPNLESRWFIVPGIIALLSLVVTLVVTSLSVAREREAGTFDQLLVTPLKPVEILVGKAMPGLVIGAFEGTFILVLTIFWFKVPFTGSLLVLYTGLLLYLMAAIGTGLMISSMCSTQQQALLGGFLFLVPAVILSGFATPIANMPALVQEITYLDPMRYFLVVVRRTFLEGASMEMLLGDLWPMAAIGLLTLAAAAWFFKHKVY